jgi:hypothetical protein
MAKHRVEIDISFDSEQDAVDLLNHIEEIKTKPFKPLGNEKIDCHRKTRYHKCTHDDADPTPCKGYVNIDFDGEKKEHIKKEE